MEERRRSSKRYKAPSPPAPKPDSLPPSYSDVVSESGDSYTIRQPRFCSHSINETYNDQFVRVTLKIPGLQATYSLCPFKKVPQNAQITTVNYNDRKVDILITLFPKKRGKSKNIVESSSYFSFSNTAQFKGSVDADKSYFKYKKDYVYWFIHKTNRW